MSGGLWLVCTNIHSVSQWGVISPVCTRWFTPFTAFTAFTAWGLYDLFALRFTAFTVFRTFTKIQSVPTTLYPNSQCSVRWGLYDLFAEYSQHSECGRVIWPVCTKIHSVSESTVLRAWVCVDDLFALRFTAFTAWGVSWPVCTNIHSVHSVCSQHGASVPSTLLNSQRSQRFRAFTAWGASVTHLHL